MSRGRGRGRGQSLSFNIEAIGFGRGDILPTAVIHPPPKYPPVKKRPMSLRLGEDQDYLLALQQEFEKTMKDSPYLICQEKKKNDIQRYSDKYRMSNISDNVLGSNPDWSRFPLELKINTRKRKKVGKSLAPNTINAPQKKISCEDSGDVVKKLQELENFADTENEKDSKTAKSKEETKESGTESEIGEFEEEDEEEENDYLTSYFDNGESYLEEDEDEKDGEIY